MHQTRIDGSTIIVNVYKTLTGDNTFWLLFVVSENRLLYCHTAFTMCFIFTPWWGTLMSNGQFKVRHLVGLMHQSLPRILMEISLVSQYQLWC